MKLRLEMTDTFGGEANYSWVRRSELEIADDASDRAIVTSAKREMGLTGVTCAKDDFGDLIALRPCGACCVLFITFG